MARTKKVPQERDVDLEIKDAEEIPSADEDKNWFHLSPHNILVADGRTLAQANLFFRALEGYGVSKRLYTKLPKEIQSLFNEKALPNEQWNPEDHI